jgi:hypothetical protein
LPIWRDRRCIFEADSEMVLKRHSQMDLGKAPASSATHAAIVVVLGCGLAGCSSVASNLSLSSLLPAAQADAILTLDSSPPGALASTSIGGACQTPCALSAPVTDAFTVTYTLDGYLPQTVSVRPIPAEKSALIDATPPTLAPNPVMAQLQPEPPPPPPPPTVKKRSTRTPPPAGR